jgi:pyrimidine-specific ribonucleoside hydrolase
MQELEAETDDVDMLVLGPATDAAALLDCPSLAERVRRIVLMGGAFAPRGGRLGNVTPFAEFNVYMDPAAAWRVVRSDAEVAFVPLDATRQRLFGAAELLAGAGGGERPKLVRELVEYLQAAHVRLGAGRGVFMHDVIAAAIWAGLLEPEWAQTRVQEVIPDGERRGLIVTGNAEGVPVRYARRIDAGRFLTLWRRTVAAL